MICVGELKDICIEIEKEYGNDTPVVIQLHSKCVEDGFSGGYALETMISDNGTLFIKGLKY